MPQPVSLADVKGNAPLNNIYNHCTFVTGLDASNAGNVLVSGGQGNRSNQAISHGEKKGILGHLVGFMANHTAAFLVTVLGTLVAGAFMASRLWKSSVEEPQKKEMPRTATPKKRP